MEEKRVKKKTMSKEIVICRLCGSRTQAKLAFGLTKAELRDVYENTIGGGGKKLRAKTKETGYVLFAKELERLSKK